MRFTTQFINPYGERETGIFMALKYFRDDYSATQNDDVVKLKALSAWFISLSWFKDSSKEHINRIHELIEILERYDIVVERITSKNPGYIVYDDEFQISAIPFKTDRNKVI